MNCLQELPLIQSPRQHVGLPLWAIRQREAKAFIELRDYVLELLAKTSSIYIHYYWIDDVNDFLEQESIVPRRYKAQAGILHHNLWRLHRIDHQSLYHFQEEEIRNLITRLDNYAKILAELDRLEIRDYSHITRK